MSVLLAALLSLSDCACVHEAELVVSAAIEAGNRYSVPADVILAVVMAETRCRNAVSHKRFDGGRDIGYAQIHVPSGTSRRRIMWLLRVRNNLMESARILRWSRYVCTGRGINWKACKRGIWSLYNSGSTKWSSKVRLYIMKLRRAQRGEV